MWKSKKTIRLFWLMLMFYGGSLFGVIDHLWNGELFLISENWVRDVMLGVVITVSIILAWGIVLLLAKRISPLNNYLTAAELK
jgi:hypothetical protein